MTEGCFNCVRRGLEIVRLQENNKAQLHAITTSILTEYERICADTTIDERAKGLFAEAYLNILKSTQELQSNEGLLEKLIQQSFFKQKMRASEEDFKDTFGG